jgi:hypothetical protein
MLEILFDSNPQNWWMWLTFIKRMNNIYILIVIMLAPRVWQWLGLGFGGA